MLARDVMTKNPITAGLSTSLYEALQTLENEEIRHLPVVDGTTLVGIVSERDLARFSRGVVTESADAKVRLRQPLSDFMTGEPVTVEPEEDIDVVIDLMIDNRIGAVPVVDPDGELVGIISYVDILGAARGRL